MNHHRSARSTPFARSRLPLLLCAAVGLLCLEQQVASQQTPASSAATKPREGSIHYDLNIENGALILADLKPAVDIHALWGPGKTHSVNATIENLVKYLRAVDPRLNLVLAPETSETEIHDLKLRSASLPQLIEALSFATGGVVRGSRLVPQGEAAPPNSEATSWTLMSARRTPPIQTPQERTVEVINVSGYIGTLLKPNATPDEQKDIIEKSLVEIELLIIETLKQLKDERLKGTESPEFRFHRGTGLLIVTGPAQAIEVTRKIVNALPGQPRPGKPEILDLPVPQTRH